MSYTSFAIVGIAIALLISAAFLLLSGNPNSVSRVEAVKGEAACADDRFMCPSGYYVTRVPPECDFAECPTVPAGDEFIKG